MLSTAHMRRDSSYYNLDQLGASYYTGNCHKWMCTPSSAFQYVRPDRQASVHPLTISHGASIDAEGVSRFRLEFDWVGTDPSALLSIPAAIDHLGDLRPRAGQALCSAITLARAAQPIIAEALGTEPLCPDDALGRWWFSLGAQAPEPRGVRASIRSHTGCGLSIESTYPWVLYPSPKTISASLSSTSSMTIDGSRRPGARPLQSLTGHRLSDTKTQRPAFIASYHQHVVITRDAAV